MDSGLAPSARPGMTAAVDSATADVTLFAYERKVQNGAGRMSDLHSRLKHQSLGRPLTEEERALAAALEKVFITGQHDFAEVARALERDGVKRPSGEQGPWTVAVLEAELKRINTSLDAAYAEHGIGA
jgi:hypothetical protein